MFPNFWSSKTLDLDPYPDPYWKQCGSATLTKYNYSGCRKGLFFLSYRTSRSGRRTCHPQRTTGSPQNEIVYFFQLGCEGALTGVSCWPRTRSLLKYGYRIRIHLRNWNASETLPRSKQNTSFCQLSSSRVPYKHSVAVTKKLLHIVP